MKAKQTPKKKTRIFAVRLPADIFEALRRMAEREDRSWSYIAVRAIRKEIKK
jgi:predicted transcriptional regulator